VEGFVALLIKNPIINEINNHVIVDKTKNSELNKLHLQNNNDITELPGDEVSENYTKVQQDAVIFVDDKLVYRDMRYLQEDIVKQFIDTEVQLRKAELEEEYKSQIQSGCEKGYSDGVERVELEYDTKNKEIHKLFEEINRAHQNHIEEIENRLKEIIFIAICKTFGELLNNRDERLHIINNVVDKIKNTNPVKIKISQEDYKLLFGNENNEFPEQYKIEADSRVGLGGCIVDTDNGTFDGRLEIQLAKLNEAIKVQYE